MIRIYNESCLTAIDRLGDGSVNVILTSPPYNTQPRNDCPMYDVHDDEMGEDEYKALCTSLFTKAERVLRKDGVIVWNTSYGAHNGDIFVKVLADICEKTAFTIADVIVWKKNCAFPNNLSPNRLTRICEFVFVLVRRSELATFFCNKAESSVRERTGQKMYVPIYNIIEAKNNDGTNGGLNYATFSTDFARQLLTLYYDKKSGGLVFDPFMGTGTTASAARDMEIDCVGAEISEAQCDYAKRRLDDMFTEVEIVKPQGGTNG